MVSSCLLLEKYSSLTKLLRITAYCLRWKAIIHKQPVKSWLSPIKIKKALTIWVKYVQVAEFNAEIQRIKNINKFLQGAKSLY